MHVNSRKSTEVGLHSTSDCKIYQKNYCEFCACKTKLVTQRKWCVTV